ETAEIINTYYVNCFYLKIDSNEKNSPTVILYKDEERKSHKLCTYSTLAHALEALTLLGEEFSHGSLVFCFPEDSEQSFEGKYKSIINLQAQKYFKSMLVCNLDNYCVNIAAVKRLFCKKCEDSEQTDICFETTEGEHVVLCSYKNAPRAERVLGKILCAYEANDDEFILPPDNEELEAISI
ncbi:MAG: hypothetical protein IKE65_02535, partial [Clostridia bacterium]|nr:hypothetical protein [Clostridia bacterium]